MANIPPEHINALDEFRSLQGPEIDKIKSQMRDRLNELLVKHQGGINTSLRSDIFNNPEGKSHKEILETASSLDMRVAVEKLRTISAMEADVAKNVYEVMAGYKTANGIPVLANATAAPVLRATPSAVVSPHSLPVIPVNSVPTALPAPARGPVPIPVAPAPAVPPPVIAPPVVPPPVIAPPPVPALTSPPAAPGLLSRAKSKAWSGLVWLTSPLHSPKKTVISGWKKYRKLEDFVMSKSSFMNVFSENFYMRRLFNSKKK